MWCSKKFVSNLLLFMGGLKHEGAPQKKKIYCAKSYFFTVDTNFTIFWHLNLYIFWKLRTKSYEPHKLVTWLEMAAYYHKRKLQVSNILGYLLLYLTSIIIVSRQGQHWRYILSFYPCESCVQCSKTKKFHCTCHGGSNFSRLVAKVEVTSLTYLPRCVTLLPVFRQQKLPIFRHGTLLVPALTYIYGSPNVAKPLWFFRTHIQTLPSLSQGCYYKQRQHIWRFQCTQLFDWMQLAESLNSLNVRNKFFSADRISRVDRSFMCQISPSFCSGKLILMIFLNR